MKVRLRGTTYRVKAARLRDYGDCDNPQAKRPTIRIGNKAFSKAPLLLDVLIHEALHACFWDLKEEAIADAAEDIAVLLIALGVVCDPKKVRESLG